MITKKFLLFTISLVLFGVSFVSLICAMVLHAVMGDESLAPAIIAGISFASSFIAVISICLFSKEKGEKQ
ncbi:MAG: hypothetical protein IJ932_01560 [Ruminococcus sp.]|nr:hypothetical protein [Ruminococcus sp.]